MEIPDGGRVLEIGYRTGGNLFQLLQLSRLYPQVKLFGLNIFSKMLKTTSTKFDANDLRKDFAFIETLPQSVFEI